MNEPVEFLGGRIRVHAGDSREVVRGFAEGTLDACVCDPPYALVSIVKRFGSASMADATKTSDRSRRGSDGYARAARGFMGKKWDTGETAFDANFWAEVGRVLKPGAHLVAFGGTRSYHHLACAIEDAGFEVRDQIGWAYGSGFPKSHNAGNGWGTALKPAWEPIILARKPLIGTVAENVQAHGTGALNIDGCRVATVDNLNGGTYAAATAIDGVSGSMAGPLRNAIGRPFVQPMGRWPANIIHDGSEEVLAGFPEQKSGMAVGKNRDGDAKPGGYDGGWKKDTRTVGFNDAGSAARFFYTAKADANDRIGSKHPTVKPVDLMRWLCRLITPPGGTILDPFAGTGTTGEAAFYEGFNAVLIEREAEYVADIERRMRLVLAGPDERQREITKAAGKTEAAGGLFA